MEVCKMPPRPSSNVGHKPSLSAQQRYAKWIVKKIPRRMSRRIVIYFQRTPRRIAIYFQTAATDCDIFSGHIHRKIVHVLSATKSRSILENPVTIHRLGFRACKTIHLHMFLLATALLSWAAYTGPPDRLVLLLL